MKPKERCAVVVIVLYVLVFLICRFVLQEYYLPGWASKRAVGYTWIVTWLLLFFDKTIAAMFHTVGTVVGLIIGQLSGDLLRAKRMAMIQEDTSPMQVYQLSRHFGVYIWFAIQLLFLVVGILVGWCYKKKRESKLSETPDI